MSSIKSDTLSETPGYSLPTYQELDDMPEGLKDEVRKMAVSRLESLFIPRVKMWLASNKRNEQGGGEADGVIAILTTCPLLANWPTDALKRLYQTIKTVSFTAGETIDEIGGLLLIYEGSVTAPGQGKGNKMQAPCLLGGDTLLTDNPDAAPYITLGGCRGGLIQNRVLLREIEKLPRELQDALWPPVLESRKSVLDTSFKLTGEILRKCSLFEQLTNPQLDSLAYRFRPMSFKAGSVIFERGSTVRDMVIVMRGEAESTNLTTGASVHLNPGDSFGEMGLIFNEQRTAQLRARKLCDVWCIEASVIKSMFSADPDFASKVSQAAHLQRLQYLSATGNADGRHLETLVSYLKKAPLLRDLRAPDQCFIDIAQRLVPTVSVPGQQIVSAVDTCVQLLLFSKGKAVVRQNISLQNVHVETGDILGFTCLAEHRWLFPVTAVTTCDVWRLSKTMLYEILEKYNLIKQATYLTKKLLMAQGGVPNIGRSESDPPLLHPLKGLPQGVGHIMSYAVRPPNEIFAPPEVQLRPVPPGKQSFVPVSETMRMEGLRSQAFSPRKSHQKSKRRDVPSVETPTSSFLPSVASPGSETKRSHGLLSPSPHPPASQRGWILSGSTDNKFALFPSRNLEDAQRGHLPPHSPVKKTQSLCLPCLAPVPPQVQRRYTARSLTSKTHGSTIPWENSLRAEGPRRGGQGISCL